MAPRSTSEDLSLLVDIVIAVVVIAILYFAQVVLVPLALAILLAFVLFPVVRLLERARLGRAVSAVVVMLLTLAIVGGIGYVVTKQFAEVLDSLPQYQSNLQQKIDSLKFSSPGLKNASDALDQLAQAWVQGSQRIPDTVTKKSPIGPARPAQPVPVQVVAPPKVPIESVQNILKWLLQGLIVIVLTTFMLIQRESVRNRFISLVGQRRLIAMTHAMDEAGDRVSRYLRAQLTVNALYGGLIGVGLYFIGLPGALLWGVLVGVLRFIPYVGPPLGGVMPLLLSLAIFHGWKIPLLTLGLFVTTELLAAYVVEPMWYGTRTGVFPLALLLAAIFWTFLWGSIGLVLSTPLTVCLVVLGRHLTSLSFLPVLLGDATVLSADTRVYQRLLAVDQEEAEQVIENLLANKPLEEVYDSVLLPVMAAAEQDRYREYIDESSEKMVCQSVREIIDDIFERYRKNQRDSDPEEDSPPAEFDTLSPAPKAAPRILCLAARDEADEIVGLMLAQLLEDSGHAAASVSYGPLKEIIQQVRLYEPEVICISALSPFVISHTRSLYRALRLQFPKLRVVVGLWSFPGETVRVARRIGLPDSMIPVTTLAAAVQQVNQLLGTAASAELSPAKV